MGVRTFAKAAAQRSTTTAAPASRAAPVTRNAAATVEAKAERPARDDQRERRGREGGEKRDGRGVIAFDFATLPLGAPEGPPGHRAARALTRVTPRVQRKCACGALAGDGETCAECAARKVMRKPAARFDFARLPLRAPSAGSRVAISAPGDRLEVEADRMADQALRTLAGGTRVEPVEAPTHAAPQIQREAAAAAPAEGSGGFLVDDDTETVMSGQMRKSDFLRELRAEVCRAADAALARAGRDTRGCPYVERWLGYYAQREAVDVERAIRKYAGGARGARSASDYIPLVRDRVQRGVDAWVETGEMPDDLPAELRVQFALGAGVMGALTSSLMGAVSGALTSIGKLLFKGEEGGARGGVDPGALSAQLGPGRPLDGTARARMGAAFGYGFEHVRIHDDARAASLSKELHAHAFTLGEHVAFAHGAYRPGTPEGDALLAHELAHVVQQGGSTEAGTPVDTGQVPALEDEADSAAASALEDLYRDDHAEREAPREKRGITKRSGLRLQRCASAPRAAGQQATRLSPRAQESNVIGPSRPAPDDWGPRVAAARSSADRAALVQAATGVRVVDGTAAGESDGWPKREHLQQYSASDPVINYDDNLNRKRSRSGGRVLRRNAGFTFGRYVIVLGPKAIDAEDFDMTLRVLNHEFDHVRQGEAHSTLEYDDSELDAWTSSFIRDFHRSYNILERRGSLCYVNVVALHDPLIEEYAAQDTHDEQREASVRRLKRYHADVVRPHAGHTAAFNFWIFRAMQQRSFSPNIGDRLNTELSLGISAAGSVTSHRLVPCEGLRALPYPPVAIDPPVL